MTSVFQVKHFVADYPLQIPYMLRKFRPGWDFFIPLSAHCFVHSIFTVFIALYWNPSLWWLGLLDFVAHFVMDRLKSGPKYLGRYNNMAQSAYWISFGFDQMVHHLTHIYIAWVLITQTP